MASTQLVDCAGRRRSPATLPGYHRGRPPRSEGLRYPAYPPIGGGGYLGHAPPAKARTAYSCAA
jgi:hypothetical protein